MRTQNSIKNIITTVLPFVIIGILGFIKVKVFVAFLQDDLYSLNQLFYQIFSYLSLAEAGFGLLITQKYYKAISKKDKTEIKSIYSTSIAFFRWIGVFIILVSLGISFFIDIFTKAEINKIYMQMIFMIFVIKNSVDYFLIAPRFLISADQKMFMINVMINVSKIIEILIEILLIWLGVNYFWILLPGIGIRIIFNLLINKKVFSEYPYIKDVNSKLDVSKIKGVRHLIIQRLAGIFHGNTDIVLISSFINPTAVVSYTSYMYITKTIFDVVYIASGAITASLADLLNSGKKKASLVFEEFKNIYVLIASFVFVFLGVVLNDIVKLWVGDKYVFDVLSLFSLLSALYLQIVMRPFYMAVDAEGHFKQVKKIISCEAFLNLFVSIILVKIIGVSGVILGTFISSALVVMILLPKLVYGKIVNGSYRKMIFITTFDLFTSFCGIFVVNKLLTYFLPNLPIKLILSAVLGFAYVLLVNYKLLNIESLVNRLKYILEARRVK